MIKIYIPNASKQVLGGGWTFLYNIKKGGEGKLEFVDTWQECDVVLIIGATITVRAEMEEAKAAGKKIVLRVDNVPKDSRNKGTAFSRMKDFANMADYIIYQSKWAKDYAGWWLKQNGLKADEKVIYNGVDKDYFKLPNKQVTDEIYLYVQFNRDENKRFPEASYEFHLRHKEAVNLENPLPRLVLVGNFSPQAREYDFDFFAGEKINYWGVANSPEEMGDIMRKCKYFLWPAYADASSNSLNEALACGLRILCNNDSGGTPEIIQRWDQGEGYSIQEMADDYLDIFSSL